MCTKEYQLGIVKKVIRKDKIYLYEWERTEDKKI